MYFSIEITNYGENAADILEAAESLKTTGMSGRVTVTDLTSHKTNPMIDVVVEDSYRDMDYISDDWHEWIESLVQEYNVDVHLIDFEGDEDSFSGPNATVREYIKTMDVTGMQINAFSDLAKMPESLHQDAEKYLGRTIDREVFELAKELASRVYVFLYGETL